MTVAFAPAYMPNSPFSQSPARAQMAQQQPLQPQQFNQFQALPAPPTRLPQQPFGGQFGGQFGNMYGGMGGGMMQQPQPQRPMGGYGGYGNQFGGMGGYGGQFGGMGGRFGGFGNQFGGMMRPQPQPMYGMGGMGGFGNFFGGQMGQFGGMNPRFGGMMGNPMMGNPMDRRARDPNELYEVSSGPAEFKFRPMDRLARLNPDTIRTRGPESLRRLRSTQMGLGSMQSPINFAQAVPQQLMSQPLPSRFRF
mgnify:CR=1 FL=1